MDYIDIPPDPGQLPETGDSKIDKIPFDARGDSDYPVRKARVADVRGILTLVNSFAASNLMLARGPQYIYENIRDFVVAVDDRRKSPDYPAGQSSPLIIACGSLHVLWENIAEIRSTAIHLDYQHKGLGRKLIDHMKIEAAELGINMLFTWTLAEDFFKQLGFKRKGKEELSQKVWGECSRCPKYFKCDEVGMVLEI
ncbi:MAG: N-acetyltransferase [Desulfobacterales bacterium]|jgi:amino-acid N-acetyltransferase|nr:N-acetyltransferase [Desulfobacterales bacterium]